MNVIYGANKKINYGIGETSSYERLADVLYGLQQEDINDQILNSQLAQRTVNGDFIVAGDISVQNKESEQMILISGKEGTIYVGDNMVFNGQENTLLIGSKVSGGYMEWDGSMLTIAGDVTVTGYVPTGGAAADVNGGSVNVSYGKLRTGTLLLGGSGNGNGVFSLQNSSGTEVIAIDNIGVTVKVGGDLIFVGDSTSPSSIDWKNSSGTLKYFLRYYDYATPELQLGTDAAGLTIKIGSVTSGKETNGISLNTSGSTSFYYASGGSGEQIMGIRNPYISCFRPLYISATGTVTVSSLAAGASGSTVITHNRGNTSYYLLLSNDQSAAGEGYMDYVTTSWQQGDGSKADASTKATIFYVNHSTSATANGKIRWTLFVSGNYA